ncbi:glycosyltransferase family 2 protein [Aquimarina sp. 2201CG14-23]|uniref:glycosyltransferase family 2 protein n=1 Tax=Aquimarina mycalae TaxID=3040073 RepID=UPI002477D4D0|nr:glycosyltransferase family 2 protein [Aquimarina sp. 2201CG14-23]MDH7447838.1 glycosyltransferase family 2 protein [Aquimarina sp. 2201CG14-23]
MPLKLSIVMPCLNEAETLAVCIRKANTFLQKSGLDGEIIVADNGSTDGSVDIAVTEGANVVHIEEKGYGNALKGGIDAASGTYVIIGDSDDSHDLENLVSFIEKLDEGYDMVVGNRFLGGLEKGSMSFLHRYLGNPVLTFIGKTFFNSKIGDFHCGLRGFTKSAYQQLSITTTGMEFASELIVKAELAKLKITEVPTTVFPSGRSRDPHLRTWRDGWRHLRFLLLYSPRWLFLFPGIFMFLIGFVVALTLILIPFDAQNFVSNLKVLLYGSGLTLVGFQFIIFYILIKIFAVSNGLLPRSDRYGTIFKVINLEKGLLIGFVLILLGIILGVLTSLDYSLNEMLLLNYVDIKKTIIAIGMVLIGLQIVLFSFFFSILGLSDSYNS